MSMILTLRGRGGRGPARHAATCQSFLRRHARECRRVAGACRSSRREFAARLAGLVSDDRNLRAAIDHVAAGGEAPGPDGLALSELAADERRSLARALRRVLQDGSYRPGPARRVRVPKGPGRGCRTITLMNAADRVAQRAVVQVLQPLLDPTFSPDSFGARPGRGREDALARLEGLARSKGQAAVVVEDVRDAFDQVPRGRLLDILRKRAPSDELAAFVARMVGGPGGRGLAQGGPLSPLLLNLYLDHLLDRPWAGRHPGWPLLRVVDDLLVLAPDRADARRARRALAELLGPAGMPLKGCTESAVGDLAAGEVPWLGYMLRIERGGLAARLPLGGKPWAALEDALRRAHEGPAAPLRANRIVLAWLAQQGACYAATDRRAAHEAMERIGRDFAFAELPPRRAREAVWEAAWRRWLRRRSKYVDVEMPIPRQPAGSGGRGR